ncbi:unnamed protein product [Adineta steineri]|uniref:Uncharacterized protein n=1 Tax=Adineta steineri TaxID=433720 RepID=A0A815A9B8_9BILA|nr:unnamed protein product [Adineta steineri]CAF1254274.1 unnamed protein product [Adineta steineri]
MYDMIYLHYLIFFPLIVATPQINLYYTDGVNEKENADTFQHDCLRVGIVEVSEEHAIVSFCVSKPLSRFHIEPHDSFPKFTFVELSKNNITSEQLYLWSAPIDVVEQYQYYLNQLSISNNDLSMATELFYNCTLPRFGSMCQYELNYYHSGHSSLNNLIIDYYRAYEDAVTNLTCYTNLECNRGSLSACLDWSEICDGKIDCLDSGSDEEYCWQLEINECKDNEYRCRNGQCVPHSFNRDGSTNPDCLDKSDSIITLSTSALYHRICPIPIGCGDITCTEQPFTSSCTRHRSELLISALFSTKDDLITDICWLAIQCTLRIPTVNESTCSRLCFIDMCNKIIDENCPDIFYAPNVPVIFGHIYFAYQQYKSQPLSTRNYWGFYLCSNNSYNDDHFINGSKISFRNTTCYHYSNVQIMYRGIFYWNAGYREKLFKELWKYNQVFNYNSTICNASNMYQCIDSIKCISRHRIQDGINDCPRNDDEYRNDTNITTISEHIPGINHVLPGESTDKLLYARKNISFQTICDGFTELMPINVTGQNQTDETECEQWECNNIYTRCNGIWNCINGLDEIGCDLSLPLSCSSDHHLCVSPKTHQLKCLPIEKINDGKIDCFGGIDEFALCRPKYETFLNNNFYCANQSHSQSCISFPYICSDFMGCPNNESKQFCRQNRTFTMINYLCGDDLLPFISDIDKFLCNQLKTKTKEALVYFFLDGMNLTVEVPKDTEEQTIIPSLILLPENNHRRCHHGLEIRVGFNNTNNTTCLCPSSYSGEQCQYQNERVSLTIQFRAMSDSWRTSFAIVISLIDDTDERIIHSYDQFTYLSVRDCKKKFNVYLLYSTRSKNRTKQYSIHIDFYEKISKAYRGSLLYPIEFPFLPVHRLAYIIDIPRSRDKHPSCSTNPCIHGTCRQYLNDGKTCSTFCQCSNGWSGKYCTIKFNCTCSDDSLCIGISSNRPICICPMDKFGSRCLLTNTVCGGNEKNSTCKNRGLCISNDQHIESNLKVTCICPMGFSGDRCEIEDNQLRLSFEKKIISSQSIYIHFIRIMKNDAPKRETIFKTIPFVQNSVIIHYPNRFHLAFVEFRHEKYYLAVLQKTYNQSSIITKTITSSDRCSHISDIFNETILQMNLIRRIKYYHVPCQQYSLNRSCFYDETHLCLCYDYEQKRLANCFKFNHSVVFDCLGQSECENKAECFQDSLDCPLKTICACSECYYGKRCQFSSSGFGLSLDAILGYHIFANVGIKHQSTIVQTSIALNLIFILAGFINGILAMITFTQKSVREVGCGVYLFSSSIVTLMTMILFALKFWILIFAQMTTITDRSFLKVQCISLDFLLRICLSMDAWLSACVASERAMTVVQSTRFDKKKSKKIAKLVIIGLCVVVIGTSIHDPIYRRLIEEENDDEKRLWCIVTYPVGLERFNSFINGFHVVAPFVINLLSAIILITKKSRRQVNTQVHRTYKKLLQEQFRKHKRLFTAPVLLVILAIPRLIISVISKCMKSVDDSWLFLFGYFISFIPTMLTCFIFILPSKFYRKEFQKSITEYRTNIQRRLHIIS